MLFHYPSDVGQAKNEGIILTNVEQHRTLHAPRICSRVSSTANGIGQSAKRAWEEGGHFQLKAAGRPGSKRWKIADKSVFFKSEAPYAMRRTSLTRSCCRSAASASWPTRCTASRLAAGTVPT